MLDIYCLVWSLPRLSCSLGLTAYHEAAFMQASQWQDTVASDSRAIGCYENIQIRNRWLDDSQCGPAVTLQAIRWESSMWLGHWMTYSILRGFTTSHSSARNECKQCVWCGNIHRRYRGLAFDASSTRILTTLACLWCWVTSEWLVHIEACVTTVL